VVLLQGLRGATELNGQLAVVAGRKGEGEEARWTVRMLGNEAHSQDWLDTRERDGRPRRDGWVRMEQAGCRLGRMVNARAATVSPYRPPCALSARFLAADFKPLSRRYFGILAAVGDIDQGALPALPDAYVAARAVADRLVRAACDGAWLASARGYTGAASGTGRGGIHCFHSPAGCSTSDPNENERPARK
jgi:hypothetical protein